MGIAVCLFVTAQIYCCSCSTKNRAQCSTTYMSETGTRPSCTGVITRCRNEATDFIHLVTAELSGIRLSASSYTEKREVELRSELD